MDRYKVESVILIQKHVTEWLESKLKEFSGFDVISYTETQMEATNMRITLILEDPMAKMEMAEKALMDML